METADMRVQSWLTRRTDVHRSKLLRLLCCDLHFLHLHFTSDYRTKS